MQLFVWGKEGIRRIKEYIEQKPSGNPLYCNDLTDENKTKRTMIILNEMEELKQKIEKMEEREDYWEELLGNEEKERVKSFLNDRCTALGKELKGLTGE